MEEEWRIQMLYTLAYVIEFGGSPSLPPDLVEIEFQDHLKNLRAILKIPQQNSPPRTLKNTVIYPIKSVLFINTYSGPRHARPTEQCEITRLKPPK